MELVPLEAAPIKECHAECVRLQRVQPGKEGRADVASGIFRLSSVALSPLQRHLKSAHGIEAESPLESPLEDEVQGSAEGPPWAGKETWALLKETRADYSTHSLCWGFMDCAWNRRRVYVSHFQFVTPAFELVTLCGGLVVFDESKTADHQRQEIARCFEMWDVPLSQQGCITTDHESGISKGGQDLCAQIRRGRDAYYGCWVPCGAHRLQLPPKHQLFKVQEPEKRQQRFADDRVATIVKWCRATVGFFTQINERNEGSAGAAQGLRGEGDEACSGQRHQMESSLSMIQSIWEHRQGLLKFVASFREKVPAWTDRTMLCQLLLEDSEAGL